MRWDEYKYKNPAIDSTYNNRILVDVECPNCGRKIYKRTDIILTTYPAQYIYECDCGWHDTAFI